MTDLRGVRIFDGERFRDGSFDVTIAGHRIASIAPSLAPASRTLLPGFIDSHVHLGFHPASELAHRGITSVLDLGWPLPEIRRFARAPGLSVRYAGPIVTAPGGYPSRAAWAPPGTAREVSTPDEARDAITRLSDAGVSVIKIAQEPREGPLLEDPTLRALVASAHELQLPVVSHVGSLAELRRGLDAGIDVLAHGLWSDERIPDGVVEQIREHNVAVIPTLRIDPSPARRAQLATFVAAGIQILYGTDLGNPPTQPGIDVEELTLFVDAGMTIEQALASATAVPCARWRWEDRGRLAEGMRADLVLVDGDPRQDLPTLEKPASVWIGGVEQP